MLLNVETLLFDFDGTLVEPSIDFGEMKRRILGVCHDSGVDASLWSEQPVLEIIGRVQDELLNQDMPRARHFASIANRAIIDMELEAAGRVRPYAGVAEMLERLIGSGYRVGIVTRNSRQAVDRVLERWPLPHDVLLTRDDVAHVKPDPRHLEAALEALDARNSATLMCGDHPMDIVAGRAIGAITAAVQSPAISRDILVAARPDLILDRVTDLESHLDGRRANQRTIREVDVGSKDVRRRG
jgi:phosphoglycolate phosphatase